ncbi:MAG: SOS response-associated peptidase family protein [Rhodospirillales bacterium]|nr:SOS response-associated peptidase family protein [Rhodospirillales bacterium]
MCSQFQINSTIEKVALKFNVLASRNKHNLTIGKPLVRPTDTAPAITTSNTITSLKWGLQTGWGSKLMINARAETLLKKAFFNPLVTNRCIIPATSYYEWRKAGKSKIKTEIKLDKKNIFGFAGLHNNKDFTIITCAPHDSIKHIHNRMPVILNDLSTQEWLSKSLSLRQYSEILIPFEVDQFDIKELPELPKPYIENQRDLFE